MQRPHAPCPMYIEYRDKLENSIEGWTSVFSSAGKLSWFTRLKFRINPLTRLIDKYLQSPILDAGCGAGDWGAFLSEQGYTICGLDYSAELIARNQARYPDIDWKSGDIRVLPYASNYFGGVISWGVIEHDQSGPAAALREFWRVLKPGAACIVTVPVDSPRQRLASKINFGKDGKHFFQYFFTPDELANELKKCGFDILHFEVLPKSSPAIVAPRMYSYFQGSRFWLLFRILTAFAWGKRFANMTVCVARKPVSNS
jgi:SAM-dependent methyltransferase